MSGLLCNDQSPENGASGVTCVVAFSCGVILLYQLAVLPPYSVLFAAIAITTVVVLWSKSPQISRLGHALIFLLLGLLWSAWHADSRLSERLPVEVEGTRLTVSGYLCDIPQSGSFDSLRFSFCVSGWQGPDTSVDPDALPRRVRLSWYGRDGQSLPGHLLKLDVVLKQAHGTLNTTGFRYEDWLFRHGFRATGTVRSVAEDSSVSCGWHCRYHHWHQSVALATHQQFSKAENYPLIASLLIGNRDYLSDDHWQTLRLTGTIHLVAISGLHLGLVAVGAGLLARTAGSALPARWGRESGRRRAAFIVVVIACLFYALVAGFSVPTRRALVMVVVGGGYLLLAREVSVWRPYAMALFVVLVLDPFAPLDQGFWLSFGAVAVLLLVFSGRLGSPGWLKGLVIAQVAVFAGLWPLLAGLDQVQPVAGLLANLLAIPWVSLVVMPVLLVGTFLVLISGGAASGWVGQVFDLALGLLMSWLEWVESVSVPVAALAPTASSGFLAMLAVVVIVLLRYPDWAFRLIATFVIGLWFVLAAGGEKPLSNSRVEQPEIRIWDVGQGLSVLVRVGDRVLVYDTGPELRGVFSAVESTLIPGLQAMGVRTIDHLVVSHGDNDHAGGLEPLVRALAIGQITSGEPELVTGKLPGSRELAAGECAQQDFRWHNVSFEFWRSSVALSGNDASCVVRIHHPEWLTDVWLTGDISGKIEAEMLGPRGVDWFDEAIDHRIVVAPHHGSKTSSSLNWVNALSADWVIYTAGYRHRFGHPHLDVIGRYSLAGARALHTACSGEIVITLGPDGPKITELRYSARFWINGPGLTRDQCNTP